MLDTDKVRRVLRDRERTQTWLARHARVGEATISGALRGKRKLTEDAIDRMEDALELDRGELRKEVVAA